MVNRVRDILQRYPGKSEVVVVVETADPEEPTCRLRFVAQKPIAMRVTCNRELRTELNDVLGDGNLVFIAEAKRTGNRPQSVGR